MRNGPYILIIPPKKYPGKKYRNRYAYEHHVNWWLETQQIIPKGFEIHHRDGDHHNNKIDNLALVTSKEHRRIHAELRSEKAKQKANCSHCKKEFILRGGIIRSRIKQNKSGNIYCSRICTYQSQIAR